MRRVYGWLAVSCVATGCGGAKAPPPPSPAPAQAPAPTPAPGAVRMIVSVGDVFSPKSGDAAIRAFVPDVPAVDSGGECVLLRTGGNGATTVTAYFPTRTAARMQTSFSFDSAGHLFRYSELRGVPRRLSTIGMTDAQRDSALRAVNREVRSTSISFDYMMDQAVLSNRGGGGPTDAVIASVRAVESLEKLGTPKDRIARVRRLCGV